MEFDYLQYVAEGHDHSQILHDLMSVYGDDVWNFAYSMTRHATAADDITQDTFIKVYQKLASFRGESSVKTWLLSIARNTSLDYQRSSFVKKVTLMAYITDLVQASHPSAETMVLDRSVSDDVWQHVLTLPIKLREILVLYAHHDLTIQEISNLLGIPEGTVKSRLHRARTQMNKIYGKGEADEN